MQVNCNFLEVKISKFIINGGKKLSGEIKCFGAKNAAMKMIAASILIGNRVELENVPDISDIKVLSEILIKMGAEIERQGHQLSIDSSKLQDMEPEASLVRSIRASVVLIGPLLARFGQVKISHPGGDKIGRRPIDRHIKAFRQLGINVEEIQDGYFFQKGNLTKNAVVFEQISVTATENILLFAVGQPREIVIENAAIEPEIIDLIEFLKKAGAKIQVAGRKITIFGGQLRGVNHRVIPDRIEAGTFAVLAAANQSQLKISQINPPHLKVFFEKLSQIGVQFEIGRDWVYIKNSPSLKQATIKTAEYPGFSTDWQPPMSLLLTQAAGTSSIYENIFENRLGHLEELRKMGANIKIKNLHEAEILGPTKLHGAQIASLDIRSGATLIIAGLIAERQTIIHQAENIDRGYEKIEERLRQLGADIQRTP